MEIKTRSCFTIYARTSPVMAELSDVLVIHLANPWVRIRGGLDESTGRSAAFSGFTLVALSPANCLHCLIVAVVKKSVVVVMGFLAATQAVFRIVF